MMQATTSPSLPFPVMTCLPGLSRFLTQLQFLMRAHAPIAGERARDLDVFAQGCWSLACWRQPPGSPGVGIGPEPQPHITCRHPKSVPMRLVHSRGHLCVLLDSDVLDRHSDRRLIIER
jgi:hypothetical protein